MLYVSIWKRLKQILCGRESLLLSILVLFIVLELIGDFYLFWEWIVVLFSIISHFYWFLLSYIISFANFFGLTLLSYINFCLVSLGIMVCLCTWFGSSMKHSVTSGSVLLITFVIGRWLQIWMIVFQMQRLKNLMREYLIHLFLCCFISKYLVVMSCLIDSVWCAEVMQPASFVVRRWLQPRN